MSDRSSSAMEPRTCGTCKNVRYTWLDCFHAANDERYYMRCTRPDIRACEHYVDNPDSPHRRYERLAQVAREMLGWMKNPENFYAGLTNEEDWRQFEESLAGLGVSVDD